MLATGAATEIIARDQDRRTGIARVVKDIAGLGAQSLECAPAQPRPGNRLQIIGGDDDIGIDVLQAKRIGAAGNGGNRFHQSAPTIRSRKSARRPVTAAAAAMEGENRFVRDPGPRRQSGRETWREGEWQAMKLSECA